MPEKCWTFVFEVCIGSSVQSFWKAFFQAVKKLGWNRVGSYHHLPRCSCKKGANSTSCVQATAKRRKWGIDSVAASDRFCFFYLEVFFPTGIVIAIQYHLVYIYIYIHVRIGIWLFQWDFSSDVLRNNTSIEVLYERLLFFMLGLSRTLDTWDFR